MTDRADQHAPLAADTYEVWTRFGKWDRVLFPSLVGLEVEDVRTDYARMRLRYRPEIEQPSGIVHGGAIATLIDTVVVPAVGQAYPQGTAFSTIGMQIQYLAALIGEDAVAEGWVIRRGKRVVFCQAEVLGASSGKLIATGTLTYYVNPG